MAPNIKVRLRNPYHFPSEGDRRSIKAILDPPFYGELFVSFFLVSFDEAPLAPRVTNRAAHFRHVVTGGELYRVSEIPARLIIEYRRSSQALGLSGFSTPKRKYTFSLRSFKAQGVGPVVRRARGGYPALIVLIHRFGPQHCRFFKPDFLYRPRKRRILVLAIFVRHNGLLPTSLSDCGKVCFRLSVPIS